MTPLPAAIRSLAVAFPEVRSNQWWRERHADVIERAEEAALAKVWSDTATDPGTAAFDAAMRPYLGDPFRGTKLRRICGVGENSLTLETRAARRALEAAGRHPTDIDLCLVASFRSEGIGVGNGAFLVRELGLRCPAINFETACSSSVVGLHTAASLIAAGGYRSVLLVVSCTYGRDADPSSSLSWFLGDGAGAFVLERECDEGRVLSFATIPTESTCDAFAYSLASDEHGPKIRMDAGERAGPELRRTAAPFLHACVDEALSKSGLTVSDVGFFVFNTPTAWYADFCASELGIDRSKTISTYAQYANIGPALMPANLHAAARESRIRRGDIVLAYSVGSVSTASAVVFEWGTVEVHPDIDASPADTDRDRT